MGKLSYMAKRLKNMDYKKMFNTIDYLHDRTKKSKVSLFFDIVWCGLRYQAGYSDYKLFQMYDLNGKQRKTIITRGINNSIVKKYNNKEFTHYFHNKLDFNKKFNKYLNRDWMELTESNYDEFVEFTKKHKEIIVKPVDQSCGQGIEIFNVTNKNVKEIYENLLETKRILIEEVVKQCKEISKLHPSSINTLRIVTLNHQIVASYIRIGNKGNVVDNFNHDGVAAPINIETGIVDYPAIDKMDHIYKTHPMTNEPILWLNIPKWPRIKRFVTELSYVIPEMGYVGWDICVGETDLYLIEGNEFPGHDIYQLPPHRTDGIGMLPRFKKAMKEEKDNENSNRN